MPTKTILFSSALLVFFAVTSAAQPFTSIASRGYWDQCRQPRAGYTETGFGANERIFVTLTTGAPQGLPALTIPAPFPAGTSVKAGDGSNGSWHFTNLHTNRDVCAVDFNVNATSGNQDEGTPILAPEALTVCDVDGSETSAYGHYVDLCRPVSSYDPFYAAVLRIDPNAQVVYRFGHLAFDARIKPGITKGGALAGGQLAGYMGTTGTSSGAHSHFAAYIEYVVSGVTKYSSVDYNFAEGAVTPDAVITATTFAYARAATGVRHQDGTFLSNTVNGNKTIYYLKDGKKCGFSTMEHYASWSAPLTAKLNAIEPIEVDAATLSQYPDCSTTMPFRPGALVSADNNHTIYQIVDVSGTSTKTNITTTLSSLGYNLSWVQQVAPAHAALVTSLPDTVTAAGTGTALLLKATCAPTGITLPAGSPQTFNLTITGGTPPYGVSWSAPSANPTSGTGTAFTSTLPAGSITITAKVTDSGSIAAGLQQTASASCQVLATSPAGTFSDTFTTNYANNWTFTITQGNPTVSETTGDLHIDAPKTGSFGRLLSKQSFSGNIDVTFVFRHGGKGHTGVGLFDPVAGVSVAVFYIDTDDVPYVGFEGIPGQFPNGPYLNQNVTARITLTGNTASFYVNGTLLKIASVNVPTAYRLDFQVGSQPWKSDDNHSDLYSVVASGSAPASQQTGTVAIGGLKNGSAYTGSVACSLSGPAGTQTVSSIPISLTAQPSGQYSLSCTTPAGSTVTPTGPQSLTGGGNLTFTMQIPNSTPALFATCAVNQVTTPITVATGTPLNYVITPSGGIAPYHYMYSGVTGAPDTNSITTTPVGLTSIDVSAKVSDASSSQQSTTVACPRVTMTPTPTLTVSTTMATAQLKAGTSGGSLQTTATYTNLPANTTITQTVTGLPQGVTSAANSQAVSGSGTITLTSTLSAPASAAPGTYPLSVTVAAGTLTKTVPASLQITASVTPLSVSSCTFTPGTVWPGQQSTATVTTPSGGTPPFSYSWSGAVTGTGQSAAGTITSSGTATVTVTDSGTGTNRQSAHASCAVQVYPPSTPPQLTWFSTSPSSPKTTDTITMTFNGSGFSSNTQVLVYGVNCLNGCQAAVVASSLTPGGTSMQALAQLRSVDNFQVKVRNTSTGSLVLAGTISVH